MNSLHVYLVLHGWPPHQMGGVGLYVHRLAESLSQIGHRVHILHPHESNRLAITYTKEHWGERIAVSIPKPTRWSETWKNPKVLRFIRRKLHARRIDILHVHHLGGWPIELASAFPNARAVLTLHDYAIPCSRGQLFQLEGGICSGPQTQKCARCIRAQLFHSPLNTPFLRILDRYNRLKETIKPILQAMTIDPVSALRMQRRIRTARKVLTRYRYILSPSYDLQQRFLRMGFPKPQYQELPLLTPIDPAPPITGPTRFLFASTIIPSKGLHLLLDCMERYRDAELIVAGHPAPYDGWPRYSETQLRRCEQMSNVNYLGAVPHTEIPALLKRVHCLVLPSLWPENAPIIVREASAAGLEIICSDQGGAKEIAPRAHRVANGDPMSLSRAIQKVCQTNGRQEAQPHISMQEHANRLQNLYRTMEPHQ